MKLKWTPEEIDIIKSGFSAGKLVKTIANEIGRTPTAVNKFLSRAGIRTRRWSIPKRAHSAKCGKNFAASKRILDAVYTNEVVTDFRAVLGFLRSNGYAISKNCKKTFAPLDNYAINDRPISDVKLLILANRLRCEKHQPIFAVPELSWD